MDHRSRFARGTSIPGARDLCPSRFDVHKGRIPSSIRPEGGSGSSIRCPGVPARIDYPAILIPNRAGRGDIRGHNARNLFRIDAFPLLDCLIKAAGAPLCRARFSLLRVRSRGASHVPARSVRRRPYPRHEQVE
jgi:hypothetical protein